MVLIKTLVSVLTAALLVGNVDAAPIKAPAVEKRLLLPTAPLASDIDGAHLLLKNDVDSKNIIKNAYVLLSKPRDYYSGINTCLSMGDGK